MLDEIVSVTEQVQVLGTRKFDFHEKVFGHVIKPSLLMRSNVTIVAKLLTKLTAGKF